MTTRMSEDDAPEEESSGAEPPDGPPSAEQEEARKRASRRHMQISLALIFFAIAGFWGYREYRLRQRHHVTFRAYSTNECRVHVEYDPGAKLDPLVQQTGVTTPWQLEAEARQEQEVTFRVYGDASCGAVTCEITIDDVTMSRKTVAMKDNPGVDSASCRVIAVDVHH